MHKSKIPKSTIPCAYLVSFPICCGYFVGQPQQMGNEINFKIQPNLFDLNIMQNIQMGQHNLAPKDLI